VTSLSLSSHHLLLGATAPRLDRAFLVSTAHDSCHPACQVALTSGFALEDAIIQESLVSQRPPHTRQCHPPIRRLMITSPHYAVVRHTKVHDLSQRTADRPAQGSEHAQAHVESSLCIIMIRPHVGWVWDRRSWCRMWRRPTSARPIWAAPSSAPTPTLPRAARERAGRNGLETPGWWERARTARF
jgi:hypothetical protein